MALEPTEDTLYRCHFVEVFTRKLTVSTQCLDSGMRCKWWNTSSTAHDNEES